jgi:hypothetical protein
MPLDLTTLGKRNFGLPWFFLCLAFGLHTWDEAAHDFLRYYNATVLTLYGHFSWLPRMDMTFPAWLTRLLVANLVLLALTPFALRNARWLRPVAHIFAGIEFINGVWHILASIVGYSVPSVRFDGPAPGFYTAPLLLVFSSGLFWSLRRSSAPQPRQGPG